MPSCLFVHSRDFLLGFRRRKNERRKKAREELEKKEKEKKKQLKAEVSVSCLSMLKFELLTCLKILSKCFCCAENMPVFVYTDS